MGTRRFSWRPSRVVCALSSLCCFAAVCSHGAAHGSMSANSRCRWLVARRAFHSERRMLRRAHCMICCACPRVAPRACARFAPLSRALCAALRCAALRCAALRHSPLRAALTNAASARHGRRTPRTVWHSTTRAEDPTRQLWRIGQPLHLVSHSRAEGARREVPQHVQEGLAARTLNEGDGDRRLLRQLPASLHSTRYRWRS